MATRRVVLLTNHSLLAAGVEKLLQQLNELEVLELSIVAINAPDMAQRIKLFAPDVLILDSSDASLGEGSITRLLDAHPHARVISLDLRKKGISVYEMKGVFKTNLDGLLEAIRGGQPSGRRYPRQPKSEEQGPDLRQEQG